MSIRTKAQILENAAYEMGRYNSEVVDFATKLGKSYDPSYDFKWSEKSVDAAVKAGVLARIVVLCEVETLTLEDIIEDTQDYARSALRELSSTSTSTMSNYVDRLRAVYLGTVVDYLTNRGFSSL